MSVTADLSAWVGKVHCGDCLEVLKGLPDCSVDSIITDPPYELGFMGKKWDGSGVSFDPETWAACLRVAKPGAFLLAFGGTRTWHRIAVAIEDAGFEIRDTLCWMYGTGFPKSKSLRDVGPEWEGHGTALKPSFEPVIVAMKPCEGTFAANAAKWGVAGLNVDGCRISTNGEQPSSWFENPGIKRVGGILNRSDELRPPVTQSPSGRWPPNTVFSHAPGCRLVGEKRVKGTGSWVRTEGMRPFNNDGKPTGGIQSEGLNDADGLETVAAWECVDGCPVRILGEQSGAGTSNVRRPTGKPQFPVDGPAVKWNPNNVMDTTERGHADTGTAARFFPQFEAEPGFLYCAKASRSEREAGCDGLADGERHLGISQWEGQTNGNGEPMGKSSPSSNPHPTVKPIAVMRWLCRLTKTPTGGTVLDPFLGSGTTAVAAIMEGRHFIGIEQDAEYCDIARARIAEAKRNHQPQLLAAG
jgi:site-specific DNA-methyltransferase (adenine-specific)